MTCPGSTTKRILATVVSVAISATPTAAQTRRGIPFNETASLPDFDNTQVSWCYNWYSTAGESTGSLDYVPMLKGVDPSYTDIWAQDAGNAGSDYLMAYNEPDLAGIDPGYGATVYKAQLSDLFPDKFLGAPALTNADPNFTWWRTFLANCGDCKIDFWPIHWYDVVSNGVYFQTWVNETAAFAASSGKGTKIWLTEIGFRGNPDITDMNQFLLDQLPFLDNHPDVERYSFTAVTESGLDMLSNGLTGSLTTTGNTYVARK